MENPKLYCLIQKGEIMKWAARLILVCVVQMMASSIVFGQDISQTDKSVVPPSPTAYELGKYGYFPVSMYTGTATYSVPLYELKGKNLSLPISLSYYSNGIKVDQVASNVGMGWSLNAGGVITRVLRGVNDDSDVNFPIPLPDDITTLPLWGQSEYIWNHIDSEPDLYAYNFAGRSGKFVINKVDNKIYTIPYVNLKIVKIANMNFKITAEDGTVYTFDQQEETKEGSDCVPNDKRSNYDRDVLTAAFLSKITHPAGDMINLTYANDTLLFNGGREETEISLMVDPNSPGNSCSSITGNNGGCLKSESIYSKILSGITYGNITVQFGSSKGRTDVVSCHKMDNMVIEDSNTGAVLKSYVFHYTYTTNGGRMFLDSLKLIGSDLTVGGRYSFNYDNINDLPSFPSYAQDHWGYYNGANSNTTLLPITTAESTRFNLYKKSTGPSLAGQFPSLPSVDREPHYPYCQRGLLTKITYPTGGTTSIDYEPNSYDSLTHIIQVGGLRVLRVTSRESASSPAQIEHYYYTDDLSNLTKSTTNIPKKPRYFYLNVVNGVYNMQPYGCTYVNLSASSLNNIYRCSGTNIAYEWVAKSFGDNFDNGGEHYHFLYKTDSNGSYVSFTGALALSSYNYVFPRIPPDAQELAPKSNDSWNAGTLVYKKSFKKNTSGQFITLQEETYDYNNLSVDNPSDPHSKNITGYSIKMYSNDGYSSSIACSGSDYTNPISPCYGKQAGSYYSLSSVASYDVIKYITYSRWGYLKSKAVKQYDVNGLNPVYAKTYYYFDNPTHAQLTREETTDTIGNTIKSRIYYPADCDSTKLNFGTLNTAHIVNVHVDVRKYVNSVLADGQQIKYNNIGQPTDIYMAETKGVVVTFAPTNPYTFTHKATYLYDVNNNLNQITKDYSSPTTYLWSYNNTLPVAKIENATYSQVSTSLTPSFITTLGSAISQTSISSQLTQLRSTLITGIPLARTSTYTFSPVIGITSQIDPSGVTNTFEYDYYGRIKNVRDKDQNILTRKYYHNYLDPSSDLATLNVSVNSINLPSNAYSSPFAITANCSWTTSSSNPTWLTVSPASGSLSGTATVTPTPNSSQTRSATVTVTYGNGQTKTVAVSQAAGTSSTLSVGQTEVDFPNSPGSAPVTVSSDTSWTVTSDSWIGVTPVSGTGNGSITISVGKFPTGGRAGQVILTTSDQSVRIGIIVNQGTNMN